MPTRRTIPADAVVIFHSPHRARCAERAFVLKAVGIPYAVRSDGSAWGLLVAAEYAEKAGQELDAYVAENQNWPSVPARIPLRRVGARGAAGYVLVLGLVYALERSSFLELDWRSAGRMAAGPIREGEWWRTITALTLHLDLQHLIGNVVFGVIFGLLAASLLGNGLAWFSILIAGSLGNGLNAFVQSEAHTAVGASTGVMGALGLIGGYAWWPRRDLKGHWALKWSPLVGACVLLAFTGSGGERTDVVAHLTGFLAGLALGVYYGILGPDMVPGRRGQLLLGVAAAVLLVVSWAIALKVQRLG